MSVRTTAACFKASARELRLYPVLTPIIDVLPMSVLTGPRADYEAAMVAKYGDDWENLG